MTATNATTSFGIQFQRGDGATPTEAFTTIAEVKDTEGPNMSRNTHDASHHGSPGGYMEFIGGMRDGGEITFTLNWVPSDTGHAALRTDFDANARRNYRLIYPDSGSETITFPGLVTELSPTAPVDGLLEADVTIKVCGQPTWS